MSIYAQNFFVCRLITIHSRERAHVWYYNAIGVVVRHDRRHLRSPQHRYGRHFNIWFQRETRFRVLRLVVVTRAPQFYGSADKLASNSADGKKKKCISHMNHKRPFSFLISFSTLEFEISVFPAFRPKNRVYVGSKKKKKRKMSFKFHLLLLLLHDVLVNLLF